MVFNFVCLNNNNNTIIIQHHLYQWSLRACRGASPPQPLLNHFEYASCTFLIPVSHHAPLPVLLEYSEFPACSSSAKRVIHRFYAFLELSGEVCLFTLACIILSSIPVCTASPQPFSYCSAH